MKSSLKTAAITIFLALPANLALASDPFLPAQAMHQGKGLGFGGFDAGNPPGRGVPGGNNSNDRRSTRAVSVLAHIFTVTSTGATN